MAAASKFTDRPSNHDLLVSIEVVARTITDRMGGWPNGSMEMVNALRTVKQIARLRWDEED